MRQILYTIILLLTIHIHAIAQWWEPKCVTAPDINKFGGTKIAWSYQVEDPTIDTSLCGAGLSKMYQKANLWVNPIEYDDKFITVFGNGLSGTIINAMDKNTGDILWQKIYNHTNTKETRGFVCGWARNLEGDSLELLGGIAYNPYDTHSYTYTSYLGRGGYYPARIVISHDTGELLDYYEIEGRRGYFSTIKRDWNDYPTQTPDGKLFYTFGIDFLKSEDATIKGFFRYADSKTLKGYLNDPPDNEHPDNEAPEIHLNLRGPNGERPDNNFLESSEKLLHIGSNVRAYFFGYRIAGKVYYHLIKLDSWGKYISDTDITDQIAKDGQKYVWLSDREVAKGDRIRLQSSVAKEGIHPLGNKGYVEIDFDGRLLKDRTALVFDGLRPIFLKTIDLQDSDDLLHIFRPHENNNIYFYREKPDGTYTKAGELINNNRPIYAFRPVIAKQARDGDLLVAFDILLDSITAGSVTLNTLEAWGYLIKIEAEELGIATRTQDQVIRERFSLFPNPTSSTLQIVTDAEYDHVLIQSTDGRIIKRMTVSDGAVNVSSLPNGTYICTLIKGSRTISSGVKFVKMGK